MNPDQRAVLAFVVRNPDAWWQHVQEYTVSKWPQELDRLRRVQATLKADDFEIAASIASMIEGGPAAWAARMLSEKVTRWRSRRDQAASRPGYRTRAEREMDSVSEQRERSRVRREARVEAQARRDADLRALVEAKVLEILVARGK